MIPTISETTVRNLLTNIKPVVHYNGQFWLIEIPDPFKIAYTWGPKHVAPILLEPIRKIRTLHRFGSPMLFKPSIAEVLAQWPTDLTDGNLYFTTSLSENAHELVNDGFHVAQTSILKARSA